jgi:integrase
VSTSRSRYSPHNGPTCGDAAVIPLRPGADASAPLISEFVRRYSNSRTRHQYEAELTALFVATGRTHPSQLSETDVLAWIGGQPGHRPANNTIRNRLSRVCTFLRWCVRQQQADPALVEALAGRDNPLRRTPRLYGKVQGKYPARWLDHEQAYGRLLDTCPDTDVGMRDELVLRLGLGGMRAAEVIHLRISNLRLTEHPPLIAWIGKASRARKMVPGRSLVALLERYCARYAAELGRPLAPDDPLVCREKTGYGVGALGWGFGYAGIVSVQRIVRIRAEQANLGHMSPHDLRRTAAGILHRSTDDAGAHFFDLLDIQKVLGHSDPATTMRSYLDPMDTGVLDRAAAYLD